MINNTYNYDDLKNQVKAELKQAIVEGGQEALAEGLTEVMSKKLSAKKIKFDTKELTEYIQEQISAAINNVDLSKTTKKTRGINIAELMGLTDKDLKSKIKELDNIVSETAKKLDAKKLLGAIYVAQNRGIDYSEIFNEDDLKEFIKEYKIDANYIKQITEEISSIKPQQSKFFSIFVDSLKELDKVKEKAKDFRDLYNELIQYINNAPAGTRGNSFWNNLIDNYDTLDNKTKALIKTLGQLKSISDGANNQGGLIGDNKTILTRKITDNTTPESVNALKKALDEAVKSGVQCSKIIDIISDKQSDLFLEIQETAKGFPISSIGGVVDAYNPEVFKATDEQIVKLISDLKQLFNLGLEPDVGNLSNIFYDLQKGFTLIDLDLHKEGDKFGFSSFEEILKEFVWALRGSAEDINDIMGSQLDSSLMDKFASKVEKIGESLANAAKEGYAKGQDSNSPSKDFEKLEKDAVVGIQKGANESEETLKQTGAQMANDVKKGFEEELAKNKFDLSEKFDNDELEEYKNVLEDVADIMKVLSSEPKDSKKYKKNKEGLDNLKNDYSEIIDLIKMLESGSSLDRVFASDKWKDFTASISEVGDFGKTVEDILNEQDALDENLQKQKHITEEKEETLQTQEKINKVESEQNFAKDKDVENIQKESNITSELYNKLVRIQDLTNDFSIFEPEDIDESSLKEFQQTLFALSEADLKILGIKDIDSLIEDLKTVEERISEIKWQFENNIYGDESFVENDQLFDFIEKTGELEEVGRQITDTYDESGIAVQRLIDLISGIDTSKYRDELEETLKEQEQITEEKKKTTKAQEQINKKDEEGNDKKTQSINLMEEAVKKKQQEKENTKSTVKAKEEETVAEKKITEEKKENLDITNDIAIAEKEAGETQLTAYKQALVTLKELTEQQEYYHDLLEKTPPQYAIEKYDNRRNAYSKLSDDDLNAKLIEKASEPLESNTKELKKQISSILALIDEFKVRGQEINFEDVVPKGTDLSAIDKIIDSLRNYFKLLNDNSGKDYKSEWQSEIQAVSQQRDALERQLKSLAEQDPLDKIEYHLKEIINGEIPLMANEVHDVILRTMNEIYEYTGKMPKIEDYTNNSKIIKNVNNELQRRNLLNDENYQAERRAKYEEMIKAKAAEKAATAIKEESVAIKEETAAIEENINVQKGNVATENISTPTPVTMPAPINNGFMKEGGVVSTVVGSEIKSLEELKLKVLEIREAIDQKTSKFEEERSTVDAVVESERTSLNLLRDKLAEIKGYTEELYNQIGNISKIDFSSKIKVDGLSTLLSSLKDDKLDNKLTAIYTYLDDFAKAVNQIDFKNNLTQELNTILSKGEELKSLASILKSSNKKIKNAGKNKETQELRDYNNAYKVLISTEERYQELKNKDDSGILLSKKETRELIKLEGNRVSAQQRINEIIQSTTGEIKKQSDAEKEYVEHQRMITDAIQKSLEAEEKLKAKQKTDSLKTDLQKQIDSLKNMEFAPKYTDQFVGSIESEISKALKTFEGTDDEIEQMINHLKEFKNTIPKSALESTYVALSKDQQDISKLLSDNTRMSKGLKAELVDMYRQIQRYKDGSEILDDKDLIRIKKRIIEIGAEIEDTNQKGDAFGVKLKKQLTSIWQRDIARYLGLNDIIRYIREISGEVIKLDTALTELRKVSDASSERLQQSLQKSTDTAKELGSTIEDVIKVTADWARLGYNVDDAEELARVTTLFKNVGDNMSAEDASSFMISTLKGFEMEASQAMDIADKFNEVANNFAIDTMGIGDALQRSAASFNAANTDLNESIALITATNAVVQNPESVGTMWKTVSARIRGAKAELEEAGEDTEGMVESTSKLRDLVKGFTGFDIMEDEKTFKSIYEIILGIGEKWGELNDIDRAALLEALAGKRAGNALAAALNNIDDLKAAYETALNASGSAMREQSNYEQSIQFSIDRLRATAQDLAQDFLSSDVIKGTIDFLNNVLELIDKIVENTGALIPILTVVGGTLAAIKLSNDVSETISGIKELLKLGNNKKSILSGLSIDSIKKFLSKPVFGEITNTIEEVGTTAVTTATEVDEMFDIMAASQGAATYSEALGEVAAAEATVGAEASTAAVSMGTLLGIFAIVAIAIGAGVIAFNHFNVTVEEVKKEVEDAESKVSGLKSEIKDLESVESKTTAQQNRLNLLKRELAVQNQILESRKRLLLLEQTGTKATDRFDYNNYNTYAAVETGDLVDNKSRWSNFWGHFFVGFQDTFSETAEDVLGSLNSDRSNYEKYKSEFEAIDAEIQSEAFRYYDDGRKNQLINSRERALNNLEDAEEALSNSTILAEAKASELEETLLKMEEDGISKNSEAYMIINDMIDNLRRDAKSGKKENGTYDVFSDSDYINALSNHDEDTIKELINSEKSHDEIVKILKEDYSDLVGILEQNGYGVGHLISKYQELTVAEKEAKEAAAMDPLSVNDSIDSLSSLSDQMETIDTAFAELFDPNDMQVDLKNIKSIKDAFGEIEGFDLSSIEDELDALYKASSPKEAQEAVDSLANSFLKESKILDGLDKSNKDLIASELKRMGIENAEEVVNTALAISEKEVALEKEFSAVKSVELANATAEEIDEFIEETNRAGEAAQEVYLFALKKQFAAGISINSSSDIQYLIDLASKAGIAAEACDKLAIAKSRMQAVEAQYNSYKAQEANANRKNRDRGVNVKVEIDMPEVREYEQAAADAEKYAKEIEDAITKTSVSPIKPKFGGGGTTAAAQKAAKDAGSAAKDAAETFDWLETKIQRCEEEIQRLDKTVSATYKNWSSRNSAIGSEIDKLNEKIALQSSAYEVYMQKANAVGLSAEYQELVKNGALIIEEISDETLKKQIQDFKTYYEKAIQAADAIEDLNSQIAQLAKQKFDNVKSEFEGFTSEIEHFTNMIDKELSHVENMGKIAGKSFYNAKIDQNYQKLDQLNNERAALVQAMNDAVANGIEEGSADWVAMRNDIYSVDEAIADLTYEVEDLKKKMKEVAKLNFDDLKKQFENAISIIDSQKSLTDAVVSLVETSGHMASRAYYEALIEGSKESVTALRKEYETLNKTLNDAMFAGDIEEFDEQWYEMQNDISSVKNELVEAANATIEYANALRQINWDVFDRGLDIISKLNDESEFFIELLSYYDLFDKETGDWTKAGITTRGLMVQEYQDYINQAKAYGNEAESIRKLLETDPKNTTLIDRYYELIEAQRQAILNSKKEKKAVEDLYKDAYDNLLERIKKLIDAYKDALNASKELHDYENTIEEKNKTINDIQKQLIAYGNGNDTSEENRATLQKLNADLIAAQKDLQETEYDKYISDQENLLDQFYNDLEEWLNGRMDEVSGLFEQAINATNLNGALIDNTLHETADSVNYRMTDEFSGIWDKYASEDGIAASSLNILTLVNDMSNSIRLKMDELPTETRLEEFFNGDDLRLLQELTSVKGNTEGMIGAIQETNYALNQIQSNIVEYSGMIADRIDSVADAVNNLDLNVEVNVDASTGSTDVSGGTGGSGDNGGGNDINTTVNTDASVGKKQFRVIKNGSVYQDGIDSDVHASQIASTLKSDLRNEINNLGNGMTSEARDYRKEQLEDEINSIRVEAYKRGGVIGSNDSFLDAIARLLGEDHMVAAKEGERILTEDQNKNFEKMVNANFTPLEGALKDKYSMLSDTNGDMASIMANIPTPQVGNVANVGNTTTVGDINITLPNVTNKEEFVQWLKSDGQIENIIQSMTVGRMMGGNSYAKMKY